MFHVKMKTAAELKQEEKNKRNLVANAKGHEILFYGRKPSVYAVEFDDGVSIDVNQLSEAQTLSLVEQGILTSANNQKKVDKNAHKHADLDVDRGAMEVSELMQATILTWDISWDAMESLMNLYYNKDKTVQKKAQFALCSAVNFQDRLTEIKEVATFEKRTNKQFAEVRQDEMFATLHQMQKNQIARYTARGYDKLFNDGQRDYTPLIAEYVKNKNGKLSAVVVNDLAAVKAQMEINDRNETAYEQQRLMD